MCLISPIFLHLHVQVIRVGQSQRYDDSQVLRFTANCIIVLAYPATIFLLHCLNNTPTLLCLTATECRTIRKNVPFDFLPGCSFMFR